ncbi:MgtC/SapB family protein [Planomicrobium okeanokoites]|uniref:MgtC/SapB family protein n=1 Tax=Planomicrobium okeanokoites TaxID=244 RepID=UPI000A074390|nr:MgtC/SapB family protein [Planomicrobium okeanokoites]
MDFLPADYMVITIRLLMAAFLSGMIGIERETKKQPAGLRTHLLVGTGACLMMILSLNGFDNYINNASGPLQFDPSRIPSYVISGIGFLGAGTIIVNRGSVKGLATAASIWVAAGLGLVIGIGMYYVAVLSTIIVIGTLYVLGEVEKKYISKHKQKQIIIIAEDQEDMFSKLSGYFEDNELKVMDFQIENVDTYSEKRVSKYIFSIEEGYVSNEIELVKEVQKLDGVAKVIV